MKSAPDHEHPTPSQFVINVMDAHVNVTFMPTGRFYTFGRLTDPDDIAHYRPPTVLSALT